MITNKQRKIIIVLTIISVIVTTISLSFDFLFRMYLQLRYKIDTSDASSIGIIGGADGPTTIYISSKTDTVIMPVVFALLSVVGIVILIATKKVKK